MAGGGWRDAAPRRTPRRAGNVKFAGLVLVSSGQANRDRCRAVLAAMGLKQEAFYVLVWAMVAVGVVIMFDRTGRLALLMFAFGAVAALAAGLTWAILVVFG